MVGVKVRAAEEVERVACGVVRGVGGVLAVGGRVKVTVTGDAGMMESWTRRDREVPSGMVGVDEDSDGG